MKKTYTCTITYSKNGTYDEQFVYQSEHRANSEANLEDAVAQFKQRKGYGFRWVEAHDAILGEWA